MSITTTCPGCKALFRLPEDMAGAQVRCQKCEQLFVVPGALAPTIAAPPPAEEIVMATVAEPEAPQDDIVMARLTEPTDEKPAAVPKPPPLPKQPLPVDRPVSAIAALALLLLFVIGLFVTGAGAAFWVAFHLAPPVRVAVVPPLHGTHPPAVKVEPKDDRIFPLPVPDKGMKDDWNKDFKMKDDFIIKKPNPVVPTPLNFDIGGQALVNDRTEQFNFVDHGKWNQDGPYRLYRISLKEGTNYHFHASSPDLAPYVRLVDGDNIIAERRGFRPYNRAMFAYQPQRTGDYLIWVMTEGLSTGFQLIVIPEMKTDPIRVDLTLQPTYLDHGTLRVKDSLDPNALSPYREYQLTLDKNREYKVTVTNTQFPPALRIDDNVAAVQNPPNQFDRKVAQIIRTDNQNKFRIRVTSEQFGVGNYTLTIEPKAVAVQRIIARQDGTGAYTDQGVFAPSDPVMDGRGSYKDYLLAFEQGKKYRIEMTQGNNPTALLLYTPNEGQAENAIDPKGVVVTHRAAETGTYRLRVFAPMQMQKEPVKYTLRITVEP